MQEQEAVSNDAVIDDEQFTELSKVCLLLCIDKSAAVRCQGVRLGGLLQDDDAEIQDQVSCCYCYCVSIFILLLSTLLTYFIFISISMYHTSS
tara:strand:- start:619 stop:897 length:279 start_codon:yes stop_codon:yes gene_type:complete